VGDSLRHLHLARQLWTSIDARVNAAMLRIRIADRLLDIGNLDGAATEIRAACVAAEGLGSDKLRQQCRALQRRLSASDR
jgi:hypothetical protein